MPGRLRLVPALSAVVGAIFMVGAAPASAATCTNLASEVSGAPANGVVTLDSSQLTGGGNADGLCPAAYNLTTTNSPVTLQGDPTDGNVDGFDGTTHANTRILTGANMHRFAVTNLVFKNGSTDTDGGAIKMTGDTQFRLTESQFFNNHADGGKGGAVYINAGTSSDPQGTVVSGNQFGSATDATQGNSAKVGGAVSVESVHVNGNSSAASNIFANNVATGTGGGLDWVMLPAAVDNLSLNFNQYISNHSGDSGGGAHVKVENDTTLQVTNEQYRGNSLDPDKGHTGFNHFGGGLYIESGGSTTDQRTNVFADNVIKEFPANGNSHNYRGGGEAVNGGPVRSQDDQFVRNTVQGQPSDEFQSEGGGLWFEGPTPTTGQAVGAAQQTGFGFDGLNLVSAGNVIGPRGNGGGVYIGAGSSIGLIQGTVAGNSVGALGTGGGFGGSGDDTIDLKNSIVFGNGALPDIFGFSTRTLVFTDACETAGTPYAGNGNICGDPLLRSPTTGDVHETTPTGGSVITSRAIGGSPTIDKGSNAIFQDLKEICCDYEQQQRPTDGDGDGQAVVDMGADESPPFKLNAVEKKPEAIVLAQSQVLCGRRAISLVRADLRGRRVVLTGLVGAGLTGRPVKILANYGGKAKGSATLATVTSNSAGQFTATVPRPPARLFIKARFRAKVDRFTSFPLKLPQALTSRAVRQRGNTIEVRGRVNKSLLGKRNPVVVKRLVCGRYHKVGEAKPDRNGNYVVSFPAPQLATAAFYRAESKVLARRGSSRYVKQYARAILIQLTAQSG